MLVAFLTCSKRGVLIQAQRAALLFYSIKSDSRSGSRMLALVKSSGQIHALADGKLALKRRAGFHQVLVICSKAIIVYTYMLAEASFASGLVKADCQFLYQGKSLRRSYFIGEDSLASNKAGAFLP